MDIHCPTAALSDPGTCTVNGNTFIPVPTSPTMQDLEIKPKGTEFGRLESELGEMVGHKIHRTTEDASQLGGPPKGAGGLRTFQLLSLILLFGT